MKRIITYLFLVLFSIGSLQAGTHYCVGMDMQDEPDTSMSGDEDSCHFQSEESSKDNNSDNTCCDDSCGSCVSVVVAFNSLADNFEFDYTDRYKQYGSFSILSNHIKIPTPPPNS